jgi:hypothetical protein
LFSVKTIVGPWPVLACFGLRVAACLRMLRILSFSVMAGFSLLPAAFVALSDGEG